jgi:hypothetical protein
MLIAPGFIYAVFGIVGAASDRITTFAGGVIIGWVLAVAIFVFSLIQAIIALIHLIEVAS